MNDTRNEKRDEKWRSETLREERKARLARMKSKDGGKKPVRSGNPALRVAVAVILIVAMLLTGGWFVLNSGLPQQTLKVMTVGTEPVKVIELNYYYHMLASNYYNIDDLNSSEAKDTLGSPSDVEGFATTADYLIDLSAKEVQKYVILAGLARQNGLTLSADDQTTIQNYYDDLSAAAAGEGLSVSNYMARLFGKGASPDTLRPTLERLLLGSKYADQKLTEGDITDDAIQAYYNEHKDEFDILSFRAFTFVPDIPDNATAEQTTAAETAAKDKASAMLAAVTDETTFKAQCLVYASADDKSAYETDDASLYKNTRYSDVSSLAQSTWLFDENARKPGDKTLIEETDGSYTVLYFISRSIDTTPRIDVRHILVEADRETATADEIATAKAKAEGILANYLSGAKTEESFSELAKTNSSDGNASTGGLYEGVAPGDMVSEFNDWCFDTARVTGDTGIVQSDFGFHVMYFVGQAGVEWQINIKDVLQQELYQKFLDAEVAKVPFALDNFGKRFLN